MDDGNPFKLREAKHDDYEAVMKMASIDTFRDGFDYFPAKFHQYVEDPDVFVIVTEKSDSLVAISVYMFNDDGEALLVKTARQNPKYKGMGASRRMRQATPMLFKDFLLQRCTPATLVQGVVEAGRMDARKLVLRHLGFTKDKEKCNFDVMYFQSDVSAIQSSLTSSNTTYLPPLTPYQPPDLHRLLPPAFSAAVLPEGHVLVDWDPYSIYESNMNKFVETGCYILASRPDRSGRQES